MLRMTIFLTIACVICLAAANAAEPKTVSLKKVQREVQADKAVLVDVRERVEWDSGHLQGSIFLPLSDLVDGITKDELARLPKEKTLYTFCVVGQRATTAERLLKRHGFTVTPIRPGGYKELIAAGFPKADR